MQIREIHVQNFLKIQRFDLALTHQVCVIAGMNESGKTSLQEAIRMAITGQMARIDLKKDMPELIHDGKTEAVISITSKWPDKDGYKDVTDTVSIKGTGKVTGMPNEKNVDPALIAVLNMHHISTMPHKERRSHLFNMAGINTSVDAVIDLMRKDGVNNQICLSLRPYLANGFHAAHAESREQSKQSRALWRSITKEDYGSTKADGWQPPIPKLPYNEDISVMESEYQGLLRKEGEFTNMISVAENTSAVTKDHEDKVRRYEEVAKLVGSWDEPIVALQGDKMDLDDKLTDLRIEYDNLPKANRTPPDPIVCPECGTQLEYIPGERTLIRFEPPQVDEDRITALEQEIRETENAIRVLLGKLEPLQRKEKDAKRASEQLQNLLDNPPVTQFEYDVQDIKKDKSRVQQEIELLNEKMSKQRQAIFELGGYKIRISEAQEVHKKVQDWEHVEKMLAPDGIPAKLLEKALKPLNDTMAENAIMAGWGRPLITDDVEILYNDRPYYLLSESAQWRCDALICHAIARQNGIKTLVFDRADVLDIPGRGQMMDWLKKMTKRDSMIAIVFATLKQPTDFAGVQNVWLSNGVISNLLKEAV